MQRERLSTIRKRHGSLTGRVHGHEEEDGCGDAGDACVRHLARHGIVGDEEGEAAEEEADTHEREGG